MDPWNTLSSTTSLFSAKDITFSQVLAAKKALKILADNKDAVTPIVQLCLACSENDIYTIKELLVQNKELLSTLDSKGLTPLIYAICFHNMECIELLLTFEVDCNEPDSLIGWTPAMWATHLDYVDVLERLVAYNADPMKKVGKSMKNAIDLMKPGSKCEEYLKIHGYLRDKSPSAEVNETSRTLQNLSLGPNQTTNNETKFIDDNDLMKHDLSLPASMFNFNSIESGQYIKFNDGSIREIMDYVFTLPKTHHSKPIYPSSIIFQCMRYAESKLKSGGMVESLIDLYLTRIRGVIGTQSGFVQFFGQKEKKELEKKKKKEKDNTPIPPQVDIVTISYWISALNHMYYFLIRDSACNFLPKYPNILQEIINTLQSLITKLAFIIDARLEPLLEPCLLEYTSTPELDVSYKNDWKLFKNKHKNTKTSYEEIIDMLYPPSYSEQMKPSPLKVIQTLGALVYVLELFHISDLIKQQCLSAVFYYIGCNLFNKIVSSKKYCNRIRGMEIRLNLSHLEDWLRANNFQPFIEEDGNFNTLLSWRGDGFPDKVANKPIGFFTNVCRYNGDKRNPNDATYYMNPLYQIGVYCLQPVIETTEWLQVMTVVQDLDSLNDILENFEVLSSSIMVQLIRNYHYEVDEKKFSKKIKKWLKENPQHMNLEEMKDKGVFYKDESLLVLNQTYTFPISLPNHVQLLHQYGADFKHIDNAKLVANQPHIPLEIRDRVETIVDENDEKNENEYQNHNLASDSDTDNDAHTTTDAYSQSFDTENNGTGENNLFADAAWENQSPVRESPPLDSDPVTRAEEDTSNLFKNITVPSTTARKTWEDDNPWA